MNLITILSTSILLYIVCTFIYAFLFSPVRKIPGPWYSRISRLPLLLATYQMRRTQWVADLMSQYNSTAIVIAPDQIHTVDERAMKVIYDKTAIKTRFYANMGSWKGVKSTLGFIDYPSAAPTRNNLIRCFQNQNLFTLAESIQGHVLQLREILLEKSKDGEIVDGVIYFRLLALDIVTDVLWGEERTLLSEMDGTTPDFLRRFHAFSKWNALKASVPGADFFVRWFGSTHWRRLRSDCDDLDMTAKEALQRWEAKDSTKHSKDVLSMLQKMADEEDPKKRVPNAHLPAYLVEMLAAGSSTTSHTIAFTFFLLARHENVQKRLREELFMTYPDPTNLNPRKTLELPFLEGVLKETMRLYPMIPGPLERFIGKEIQIMDQIIPPGVVASTGAYSQGRLTSVFPQPHEFLPERWLDASDRMEQNWIPFGTGSRSCPGSNLAMYELKYMLGTLLRSFKSVIPEGHENDVLELADIFAAGSRTGHCWLKFETSIDVP